MSNKNRLRDELDWTDGTRTFERDMLKKAEAYGEIIIFGAGIGGMTTYELLKKYGQDQKVKAFSDNNKDKIGQIYLGKPVIAPAAIESGKEQLILISSTAFDIISEQLLKLGLKKNNLYFFQPAGISLEKNSDLSFVKENIHRLEGVYERLADEKSKKIYRCLLNYRISKSPVWLEQIRDCVDREENQYFDRELLSGYGFSEGFVDAGAYVGDTAASFFSHFPQYEGSYYCMEAGTKPYERLCRNLEKINAKKMITYQCAVWNKKGTLKFDTTTFGDGGGSRVSEEGETVECDSLDHLLAGKEIGFIKMDIEGAEKRALLGAERLIRECRPILAICIYHKPEDFFDIPETILNIAKDEYSFYVRQYRYGQSETVLYAMPKSRKTEGKRNAGNASGI